MSKYYAKEMDPESFNYELYYGPFDAEVDNLWAGGNRDFSDINSKLIDGLEDNLNNFNSEVRDETYEEDLKSPTAKILKTSADRYFTKRNGSKLSLPECSKLLKLSIKLENCRDDETYEVYCKTLEILHNKPFKFGTFKGSCQRDWMDYICPESMSDSYLRYIEAVFFATGTEFMVTEEMIDSADNFDDVYSSSHYTAEYNNQSIKEDLAKQISGCTADDIVLLLLDRSSPTGYKEV